MAIEHCVPTRRLFRRIAEAAEEGEQEEATDRGSTTFVCCADIVRAILATKQNERDQQSARKRRRRVDNKVNYKTLYAPPGTALDELMLHLHLGGIACRGRLTSYSYWDSLSLPAHGITIRTWCGASMGGLDPDLLECDQATRLIELQNTLGRKLYRGVMDFRVSSQ